MLKTTLTRGLLLVVVLVWIGACSSGVPSTQPVSKPTVPVVVPTENICNWPDYCHPQPARMMLDEIAELVEQDASIEAELREKLNVQILRCKSPGLRNTENRHVCDLQNPLPCDELREILDHAMDSAWGAVPLPRENPKEVEEPKQPVEEQGASLPGHWETIAQELEGFPTGK